MRICSFALLIAVFAAPNAFGQYPGLYYGMGSNNYRHASTVQEGAARGMADVIRSTGAANLMNSEAAKNFEATTSVNSSRSDDRNDGST